MHRRNERQHPAFRTRQLSLFAGAFAWLLPALVSAACVVLMVPFGVLLPLVLALPAAERSSWWAWMGVGWFAGQLCATTMVAVGVLAVVLNARLQQIEVRRRPTRVLVVQRGGLVVTRHLDHNARLQQIEVPTSSSTVPMFDACVYVIAAASIDPAAASINGRCFGRCRAAASMDIAAASTQVTESPHPHPHLNRSTHARPSGASSLARSISASRSRASGRVPCSSTRSSRGSSSRSRAP